MEVVAVWDGGAPNMADGFSAIHLAGLRLWQGCLYHRRCLRNRLLENVDVTDHRAPPLPYRTTPAVEAIEKEEKK